MRVCLYSNWDHESAFPWVRVLEVYMERQLDMQQSDCVEEGRPDFFVSNANPRLVDGLLNGRGGLLYRHAFAGAYGKTGAELQGAGFCHRH